MNTRLVFLLTFLPLFIAYILLLRTLLVSACPYVISLALYWIAPVVFVFFIVLLPPNHFFIVVLILLPLFADIIFRMCFLIKAARILRSAKCPPAGGNPFVMTWKRYSFLIPPPLIALLVFVVFFGYANVKTGLCLNCGIWEESYGFGIHGIRLPCIYKKTKPTAFSRFLDPKHRCWHLAGDHFFETKEFFLSQLLGAEPKCEPRKIYIFDDGRTVFKRMQSGYKSYIEDYSNINEASLLYPYLCEKNSPSLARRIVSGDLSSDEAYDFYKAFLYFEGDEEIFPFRAERREDISQRRAHEAAKGVKGFSGGEDD